MASPGVMAPASSPGADLACQAPLYTAGHLVEFAGEQTRGSIGSLNMEELLRQFYADSPAVSAAPSAEISPDPGASSGEEDGEGVADAGGEEAGLGGITLEAYLARAGAAAEEDVGAATGAVQLTVDGPVLGFVVDPALRGTFVQQQLLQADGSHAKSGNGVEGGKKRTLKEPLDKASQQKQRRMIKNRESAARSRERKQAYTADLEKSVAKLEEEHARLFREQEEQNKARLKQLMENLIPVDEKKRPPRRPRRACSVDW